MTFSSILFLIYFLPIFLAVYSVSPDRFKNGVLLAFSLVFYGWNYPPFLLLILSETAGAYWLSIKMDQQRDPKKRKLYLIAIVGALVFCLCFFKYFNFIVELITTWTVTDFNLPEILLPLGISFYTFQILSYVFDLYHGTITQRPSLFDFMVYICMFPQLVAGPIVNYQDIAPDLKTRKTGLDQKQQGLYLFIIGLAKKVLLANNFYAVFQDCKGTDSPDALLIWIAALCNILYIYFDFSGYSDMARGLGQWMGFKFPLNFNYPLSAGTISGFWRRWHMSLTGWFRTYVYIPLGGNRKSKAVTIRNLLIVWFLTGIWHGAGFTYMLWGLAFFALIVFERFIHEFKIPLISRMWLWFWILILFLLFSENTVTEWLYDLHIAFGLDGRLYSSRTLFILFSNLVLIVIGLITACNGLRFLKGFIEGNSWLMFAGAGFLLIFSIASLASENFNPFLYFNF